MPKLSKTTQRIRNSIILHINQNFTDLVPTIVKKYEISRQAVNKHLKSMVSDGIITAEGHTRNRKYKLAIIDSDEIRLEIENVDEFHVFDSVIKPFLGESLKPNILEIWEYGVTEMINNVIDHSQSPILLLKMNKTAIHCEIQIIDTGIGIFKNIKEHLNLQDEEHAVLELIKGKFTTDPENHTGQGIFFTSRVFDDFSLLSHEINFTHVHGENRDWISDTTQHITGTVVVLTMNTFSNQKLLTTFNQFSTDPNEGLFDKTIIPVSLVKMGSGNLVSRSEAKRLLTRLEGFGEIMLDFNGVKKIGQAFADQIFRVYVNKNPQRFILPINTNKEVEKMIKRARAGGVINK